MISKTYDLNPKDVIEVGSGVGARKVVVVESQDDGVVVCWFTPEGIGPYTAKLPHAEVSQFLYENERLGQHKSWWETHPDITGRTGEI